MSFCPARASAGGGVNSRAAFASTSGAWAGVSAGVAVFAGRSARGNAAEPGFVLSASVLVPPAGVANLAVLASRGGSANVMALTRSSAPVFFSSDSRRAFDGFTTFVSVFSGVSRAGAMERDKASPKLPGLFCPCSSWRVVAPVVGLPDRLGAVVDGREMDMAVGGFAKCVCFRWRSAGRTAGPSARRFPVAPFCCWPACPVVVPGQLGCQRS